MPDVNPDFLSELKSLAPQTNNSSFLEELKTIAPKPAGSTGILPMSEAALSGVNKPPQSVSATPDLGFQQLYGRHDENGALIPIDTSSGLPMGKYWRISQQSDPEAKADALQKMYPDKKVRILDSGDITLQVNDSVTGKPKDVLINPRGIDSHDLLDLASQAPELGFEIATFIATKGRGALRRTGQIIASAFAGAAAGEVRDVATRAVSGIPIRPEDISRERRSQELFDVAGQGAGLLGGAVSRALSPFAREIPEGSLAFNLREGVDFMKKNYGIDYQMTPGMRTGNSSLLAVEAAESPMPGARGVMGQLKAKNENAIQQLQSRALGNVTPNEQIGEEAIGSLRNSIVQPLENAVTSARDKAVARGDKRIVDLLDDALGTPVGQRVTPSQAGEATLKSYNERMALGQSRVDEAYAKVNELPGGTGDILSGTPAANAAAAIRKEIPGVLKKVEKPGYDAYGSPITKSVEEKSTLNSGVPDGLLKALDDLESLKDGKVSLQTLTNMKKAAFDAIAAFKTAHGDVKDRWFSKISGAYEQGIQSGIEQAGDPELKTALSAARDTYKKEIVPFERTGVKELAKDAFDPGKLSPEEVMRRMFEGPKAIENYKLLKETLGENDPSFRILKRAWGDTVLSDVTDPVTKAINPDALSSRLKDIAVNRPELASELFGKNYQSIMEALKIRSGVEKLSTLDDSAIKTLINLKDPTAADFKNLVVMSAQRDKAYVNGILKDIGDGLPLDDFEPTKFVSTLRNTKTPTEHVQQILDSLPTDQRQAVATAEFYRVLSESSLREGATASKAFAGKPVNVSPSKILQAFGTGDDAKRTALLLGEDLPAPGTAPPLPGDKTVSRVDVLENLVKVLAPNEAAQTAFHNLAGLRQGAALAQLTKGPLTYAGAFAKNMFLATAYTRGLGQLLTNRQFDGEAAAVVANTLIASEPFLRASTDAFGSERTKQMVAELKSSIDKFVFTQRDKPEGRKTQAVNQFMQGQNVPMRMGQ